MSPTPSDPDYNQIYEMLVKGPEDILGLVAYGLYKSEKVAHVKKMREQNGGISPSRKELLPFQNQSYSKVLVYREQAEKIFQDATNEVLQEIIAEYQKEFDQELHGRLQSDTSHRLEERIEKNISSRIEELVTEKQNILDQYNQNLDSKMNASFMDSVKANIITAIMMIIIGGLVYLFLIGSSHSFKDAWNVLLGKSKVVYIEENIEPNNTSVP